MASPFEPFDMEAQVIFNSQYNSIPALRVLVKGQRWQPYLIPSWTVMRCRASLSLRVQLKGQSSQVNLT